MWFTDFGFAYRLLGFDGLVLLLFVGFYSMFRMRLCRLVGDCVWLCLLCFEFVVWVCVVCGLRLLFGCSVVGDFGVWDFLASGLSVGWFVLLCGCVIVI